MSQITQGREAKTLYFNEEQPLFVMQSHDVTGNVTATDLLER